LRHTAPSLSRCRPRWHSVRSARVKPCARAGQRVALRWPGHCRRAITSLFPPHMAWLAALCHASPPKCPGIIKSSSETSMTSPSVILRKWTGRIRTPQQDEYVAYIAGTGLEDYAKTPGNLGFQMLLRELGNGETEVTTISWWESMDAIRAFAGATPELARYYPEDDRYLVH